MIKVERTEKAPPSLAIEKLKTNGSCSEKDVVEQLYADFHEKCYLCEQNELQSIEVEHLLPHHNGKYIDRKFDWNNLFLSCAHCNSVKNRQEYEGKVIDCCQVDPEKVIRHALKDGKVCISSLDDTNEVAKTTAKLVEECFELRNRTIRKIESQNKVRALQATMNILYKELDRYKTNKSQKSLCALKGMLSREYKFAGFTRTYVRENLSDYPDLEQYVTL